MSVIHRERLYLISFYAIVLALAFGLILYALRQNINVFMTPSDIAKRKPTADYYFRLGGMVKKKSLVHLPEGLTVAFIVTDLKREVPVHFSGVLPDLFREGSGVIVEGHLNQQGEFEANQVLAKHDENYMPRSLYQALRKKT